MSDVSISMCRILVFFLFAAKAFSFTTLASFKHDSNCFTQGLLYHEGSIFESCGLYSKSSLRRVNSATGVVEKVQQIPGHYFGEGLTIVKDVAYMLTWKEQKMLLMDSVSFEIISSIGFASSNGEGWGLTHDEKQHLIVSDGSDKITFYDIPSSSALSLNKVREISVTDPQTKRVVNRINELEYVNGFIYANIWYKDVIIKIDPTSGHVVQRYDLALLYPKSKRSAKADCLNGIAYNASDGSFLLTGKLWPKYYKVQLDDHTAAKRAIVVDPLTK